ncbi:sensor histidine kinase [Paenibacillus psychroresistens]|nr:HAMP domain-containing sensor histidine kinase [Paenibacillus psychroresistens]
MHTSWKSMEGLAGELNRLMNYIQGTFERTQFLEQEHKRMIANISHDLRTPLTSLLGYMEALQNDKSLKTDEREKFLRIAADKGNTLLFLLQDFFELAKLEVDNIEIELQQVDLTKVVQEALLGLYPEFTKAEITPLVDISDAPYYVRGDSVYLRRILDNLLSNALRYGHDGKEIGIAFHEESGLVRVEVWDRGKGISVEDLPHVFERLYTGEASRNASLRGTGLGLTIVKNLVEKQGGQITVSSSPGERTVFSFYITKA